MSDARDGSLAVDFLHSALVANKLGDETGDWVIMAMYHLKFDAVAAARTEMEKAQSLAQTGLNTGIDAWNWREWVYFRLLLEEAEALMR